MNAISFFTSSVRSHLWVPVLCLSFPLVPVRGRPRLPCRPPGWAGRGAAPTSGFVPREAWLGCCRRKQPVPPWTRILIANLFLGGGLWAGGGQRDPSSISAVPRSDGANQHTFCHTPPLFLALRGLTGPGTRMVAELHRFCPSRPGARPTRLVVSSLGQGPPVLSL